MGEEYGRRAILAAGCDRDLFGSDGDILMPDAGLTRADAAIAYHAHMWTVPEQELRNNLGEVLRRAEAGEWFTITVAGRPVAQLGPARTCQWVASAQLADLWAAPADPTLDKDLEPLGGGMTGH